MRSLKEPLSPQPELLSLSSDLSLTLCAVALRERIFSLVGSRLESEVPGDLARWALVVRKVDRAHR